MTENPIIVGPPESREMQRELGILVYVPPPGVVKIPCAACEEPFWIGPKQGEYLAENPDTLTLCVGCARTFYEPSSVDSMGGRGGSYRFADGSTAGPEASGRQ